MKKGNKTIENIRNFSLSNSFLGICFIFAAIINACGEYTKNFTAQIVGFYIFGILISALLVICEDILSILYPVLLVSMFSIKCYDSFSIMIKHWPFLIVLVSALLFHFIYYRKKLIIGKAFWGLLATSIAITLGGVGIITYEQYFSPTALYYTLGLGFGMLVIYVFLFSHIDINRKYQLNIFFSNIMVMMGAFACYMILHHYILRIETVLQGNGVLAFQWRNNIATFLMLALPFPFYKSSKNRHLYLYIGIAMYGCLLLTGSRGAFVFGSVEFVMCVLSVLIYDKHNRKSNIIIFTVLIGIMMLFFGKILNFFSDVTNRMTIESGEFDIRLELYQRAIKDFKSNIFFGRGLGYMGNRDIHPSTKASLCWYHSLPFQIIGSFGLVGVVGYLIQYIVRFRILLEDYRSRFTITIFLSYVGIELMSLVNPGEMCPIPFNLLIVLMFIVTEKCNDKRLHIVHK